MATKWAVRILLECFLVNILLTFCYVNKQELFTLRKKIKCHIIKSASGIRVQQYNRIGCQLCIPIYYSSISYQLCTPGPGPFWLENLVIGLERLS